MALRLFETAKASRYVERTSLRGSTSLDGIHYPVAACLVVFLPLAMLLLLCSSTVRPGNGTVHLRPRRTRAASTQWDWGMQRGSCFLLPSVSPSLFRWSPSPGRWFPVVGCLSVVGLGRCNPAWRSPCPNAAVATLSRVVCPAGSCRASGVRRRGNRLALVLVVPFRFAGTLRPPPLALFSVACLFPWLLQKTPPLAILLHPVVQRSPSLEGRQ